MGGLRKQTIERTPSGPCEFPFALICGVLIAASVCSTGGAQFVIPQGKSSRSLSGQFIINDERSAVPFLNDKFATNQNYVRLEPAFLTVSCERLKQVLLRDIGATQPWRGKIYLVLQSARTTDDTITLLSQRFTDGWQYLLDVPDVVDRTRFVRTMTRSLLLEIANRNAGTRSVELPHWLVEGCVQMVLSSSDMELILPPPRATVNGLTLTSTMVTARKEDPFKGIRARLQANQPLSFEQLSWPQEGQLEGYPGEIYSASAQLFLSELLRLNDGKACLQMMLTELPSNYNWQFAFLRGFQSHFSRPLDVEKWWALNLAYFAGRDASKMWPLRESLERLDQALRFPVQVQTGTGQAPLYTAVKLQTIIREWDQGRQNLALSSKLRELEFLRLRVAMELDPLVESYHKTIENYLQKRNQSGSIIPFVKKAALRRHIEETVAELDGLDRQRMNLQPGPAPVALVPSSQMPRQR